jgi:hypothetical protein
MMVVNVPIEPVDMRYSIDVQRWFEAELKARNYKYKTIMPQTLTSTIREGAFLDVIGTTCFKARQIASIAFDVNTGAIPRNERVVFIMHDGWFPVEPLAYMRDMLGCHDWKFVGLFRAGTYDRWDQLAQHGMAAWGEDLENAWFKIYDKIVVASHFHMNLLNETRKIAPHKFAVIPWKEEVPFADLVVNPKKNVVVFPHRCNIEKQPEVWDRTNIPESFEKRTTARECKTKLEYYQCLADSKISVSFALQETFGHAMVESVLLGCIPLVPDKLSYKEMYPETFKYKDEQDFTAKLKWFCTDKGQHEVEGRLGALRAKFENWNYSFFPKLFEVVENL